MTYSTPPEIVFYSSEPPAVPSATPLVSQAKIVLDQRRISCTIYCSTKPASVSKYTTTDCLYSKRLLKKTVTYSQLCRFAKSQRESMITDEWSCSKAELQALDAFLDTHDFWSRYT